jgi:hypothetical protein
MVTGEGHKGEYNAIRGETMGKKEKLARAGKSWTYL